MRGKCNPPNPSCVWGAFDVELMELFVLSVSRFCF